MMDSKTFTHLYYDFWFNFKNHSIKYNILMKYLLQKSLNHIYHTINNKKSPKDKYPLMTCSDSRCKLSLVLRTKF